MTTTGDPDTERDAHDQRPRRRALAYLLVALGDYVWPVACPLITPVLLLCTWIATAPLLWAMFSTLAGQPGGGYFVFFHAGMLWILGRTLVAVLGARRDTRSADANVAPTAALLRRSGMTSARGETAGGIARRARHEAAHAVAAWALGSTVTHVDTMAISGRGGSCGYTPPPGAAPVDHAWIDLVICLAGNQQDRSAGFHDHGSATDMQRALADIAAIISTGTPPTNVGCALTVDGLLTAGRDRADALLAAHRATLDTLTAALMACPGDILLEPQLRKILESPQAFEQVTA